MLSKKALLLYIKISSLKINFLIVVDHFHSISSTKMPHIKKISYQNAPAQRMAKPPQGPAAQKGPEPCQPSPGLHLLFLHSHYKTGGAKPPHVMVANPPHQGEGWPCIASRL